MEGKIRELEAELASTQSRIGVGGTTSSSLGLSAVAPLLNEVLNNALESFWQKEDVIPPMSPAFSISTTPRSTPFVRNTPGSLRRHGSHRRLHDSGLAESEGDFEDDEAGGEEDLEVFTC